MSQAARHQGERFSIEEGRFADLIYLLRCDSRKIERILLDFEPSSGSEADCHQGWLDTAEVAELAGYVEEMLQSEEG